MQFKCCKIVLSKPLAAVWPRHPSSAIAHHPDNDWTMHAVIPTNSTNDQQKNARPWFQLPGPRYTIWTRNASANKTCFLVLDAFVKRALNCPCRLYMLKKGLPQSNHGLYSNIAPQLVMWPNWFQTPSCCSRRIINDNYCHVLEMVQEHIFCKKNLVQLDVCGFVQW